MLFFKTIDSSDLINWKRPELYQNSTLRYTPGEDFPAHLEKMIGRPKMMRCFVTLNDLWDYRTGEYDFDFKIGFDRYTNDSSIQAYDRDESKLSPYGLTFMQYIRSHAEHADEVCLSLRRYEQEVKTGKLPIEKYEEIAEKVVEYYKDNIENIRYIECNEPNDRTFGAMTPFEFYQIHKCLYRIVNRLNEKHNYDMPLLLGGPCFSWSRYNENEQFLRLYALDPDNNKRLDYFTAHNYTSDLNAIPKFYSWLKGKLAEYGLPDIPLHYNEYGATSTFTPEPANNQINAALSIEQMIKVADLKDLYIYPWCSYHDPSIQVDKSQYIDFGRTTEYLPTFLGQAYIAFSRLFDKRVRVTGNINDKGVVTTDGNRYAVLVTNSAAEPDRVCFALTGINKKTVKVEEYSVDALHNNCFIDHNIKNLNMTDAFDLTVKSGEIEIEKKIDSYGFTLWIIE